MKICKIWKSLRQHSILKQSVSTRKAHIFIEIENTWYQAKASIWLKCVFFSNNFRIRILKRSWIFLSLRNSLKSHIFYHFTIFIFVSLCLHEGWISIEEIWQNGFLIKKSFDSLLPLTPNYFDKAVLRCVVSSLVAFFCDLEPKIFIILDIMSLFNYSVIVSWNWL